MLVWLGWSARFPHLCLGLGWTRFLALERIVCMWRYPEGLLAVGALASPVYRLLTDGRLVVLGGSFIVMPTSGSMVFPKV